MVITLFGQQLFNKILNKVVVLGTAQKSITLAIPINLMVVTNMSYLTLEYSGSYVAFLTKILICSDEIVLWKEKCFVMHSNPYNFTLYTFISP